MREIFQYDQEMDKARQMQRRSIVICILIIAVVLVVPRLSLFQSAATSAIQFDDQGLTLRLPNGQQESLRYDELTGVEPLSAYERGECISGGVEDRCAYGLWRNEAFGEYHLCVNTDIAGAVRLLTAGTSYVINYEDETVTEGLYKSLLETIEQLER